MSSENVQMQEGKRPTEGNPEDGTVHSKKIKLVEHEKGATYPDMLKSLVGAVGEKDRKLGMQVAHVLGMPKSTANHIMALYAKEGLEAMHDHRHDRRMREAKFCKGDEELTRVILQWLHLDASMTYEKLRNLINLEIFRKVVLDQGLTLGEEESALNCGITEAHINDYLAVPEVKKAYMEQHVSTPTTISRWLDGLAVSRKHVLGREEDVNSLDKRAARLEFAQQLDEALGDRECELVFLDEIPLLLNMHHPPGAASGSKVSQHSHVFLAVDPVRGVIKSESVFVGEDVEPGGTAPKHGLLHDEKHLYKFLDGLTKDLLDNLKKAAAENMSPEENHFGLGYPTPSPKDVYIIIDCPAAAAKHMDEEVFKALHHWNALKKYLDGHHKKIYLIRVPPMSPTLNMAEYFNSALQECVNRRIMELVRTEDDEKTKAYLGQGHLLQIVIEEQLAGLKRDTGTVVNPRVALQFLYKGIQQIIADEGNMDWQKTFKQFYAKSAV